jgi:hypothetical protein
MPFKSKAQARTCYALKRRGQAGSWDCDAWNKKTKNKKHLPGRTGARRRKKKT